MPFDDEQKTFNLRNEVDIRCVLMQLSEADVPLRLSMVQRTRPEQADIVSVSMYSNEFSIKEFNGLESLLEEVKSLSFIATYKGTHLDVRGCAFVGWEGQSNPRVARLKFPHSVIRPDARSAFRAPVPASMPIEASITWTTGVNKGRSIEGVVQDLSAGGLRIALPEARKDPWMPKGDVLPADTTVQAELRFHVTEEEEEEEVDSVMNYTLSIRWHQVLQSGRNEPPCTVFGGEFLDLEGDQSIQLSRLVVDLQLAGRREMQARLG